VVQLGLPSRPRTVLYGSQRLNLDHRPGLQLDPRHRVSHEAAQPWLCRFCIIRVMDNDFRHLRQMVHKLEQQADNGSLSKEDLKAYQQHLDALAHTYQTDENAGSQRFMLYELQALIWQALGNNDKAVGFLQEASTFLAPSSTFVSKGAQQWYKQQVASEPATVPYRNPIMVAVLGLITFNLYTIYWLIVTKNKLNEHNAFTYVPSAWQLIAPVFPYLLFLLLAIIESSEVDR
jgi:hypothetical protein